MTSCTELVMSDIESFYTLCPHPEKPDDEKEVCLKIVEGPFKDCIIQYGKVKVKADEDNNDELKAEYEYDIIFVPEEIKDKEFTDEEGEEFEQKVGEIMIYLLQKSAEEKLKQNDTKDRDPDIITFSA